MCKVDSKHMICEVAKIGVSVSLLSAFGQPAKDIAHVLLEEVSFRLFQHAVHESQKFYTRIFQNELKAAKAFRICFVGCLFGLLHATCRHATLAGRIQHVFIAIIGGITLSLLQEKYRSLAPGILYHGLHNLLNEPWRKGVDLVTFAVVLCSSHGR